MMTHFLKKWVIKLKWLTFFKKWVIKYLISDSLFKKVTPNFYEAPLSDLLFLLFIFSDSLFKKSDSLNKL